MLRNFDPEVADIILKFADSSSDEIFWDIGANKGTLSYQIARKLPRAKIVAIEPQPKLAKQIADNIDASDRWQVFQVGLGDEAKTMPLYIPHEETGSASLVRHDGDTHIEVEIETAETIKVRSGLGWPTLLKIDVEGYEPNVIRSLRPAFKSGSVKCCVFECHADKGENFREICAAVESYGYEAKAIRKSVLSSWLEDTGELVPDATDYALVKSS
jgi:FkbM family methyltransferase